MVRLWKDCIPLKCLSFLSPSGVITVLIQLRRSQKDSFINIRKCFEFSSRQVSYCYAQCHFSFSTPFIIIWTLLKCEAEAGRSWYIFCFYLLLAELWQFRDFSWAWSTYSFIVSVVQSRTALDTKQQPRVIREDKNLIKKKEVREEMSSIAKMEGLKSPVDVCQCS